MLKTRKNAIVMLVIMMLTVVMGFVGTSVDSYASNGSIFDSDFDVNSDGTVDSNSTNSDTAFEKIINKYKGVITFVSGLGAITMVGIFILNFMKLGSSSTNPSERAEIQTGLIWSGIAAAGLGSVAFIVGVFYGLLGEK